MKISKSWIYRIFVVAGFILSTQFSFAGEQTQVPIPPDDTPDSGGPRPTSMTIMPSATASISDTELVVYFEYSVGDAMITVTDANNQVVYQETVDTNSMTEVYVPVEGWLSGNYMITVTYGNITQRGYFNIL